MSGFEGDYMSSFSEILYFLCGPRFPVIIDIDGVFVAARSGNLLNKSLLKQDIVVGESYDAIDATGESWTFDIKDGKAFMLPAFFSKKRTKLNIIRWFNDRKNKAVDEIEYSEKSLSSKKLTRIVDEIADRIIAAAD